MLPKGYGEKSWYNLVATIYGMTTTGSTMTDATLASDIAIENNTAKKAPFSIFQAGYYDLKTGQAVAQGANAYYWTSYTASEYAASVMNFYMSRDFQPQRPEAKFNGSGVRCVVR